MIIDGHTHLYSRDTERYPLGDPDSTYRPEADGSADTLKKEMDAAGVDRALTITAGFYGWDNSSTMDAFAGRESWLAAGVLVDPAGEAVVVDEPGPGRHVQPVYEGRAGNEPGKGEPGPLLAERVLAALDFDREEKLDVLDPSLGVGRGLEHAYRNLLLGSGEPWREAEGIVVEGAPEVEARVGDALPEMDA